MFTLIHDQDLWQFKEEGTKEFNAGLGEMAIEYDANKNPALFETLCDLDVPALCRRGLAVIDEQNRRIAAILATSYRVRIPAGARLPVRGLTGCWTCARPRRRARDDLPGRDDRPQGDAAAQRAGQPAGAAQPGRGPGRGSRRDIAGTRATARRAGVAGRGRGPDARRLSWTTWRSRAGGS